jgi:CheY-like chemotaxis protein
MRCLLVDDEPGIREGFAALLRLRGHEVHTAADLAAADALLSAHDFDVLLSDWRLPDGDASVLLPKARCPVLVLSGHPDEVQRHERVVAVLAKPVMPDRLFEALASLVPTPRPKALPPLPRDAARVVAKALELLGPAAEVADDGVFVTVRGPCPSGRLAEAFADLGGDVRVLDRHGVPFTEARWLRDGRPDAGLPTVPAGQPWPSAPEFCVDFDAVDFDAADCEGVGRPAALLAELAARALALAPAGVAVRFLNLPDDAAERIRLAGSACQLPEQSPIGPRLREDLAALWR